MGIEVKITSNRELIEQASTEAIQRALEAIGLQAEGYAKMLCPVDTGNLRNSISHTVNEDKAIIGTNVEYAAYVEFGTGKFAQDGKGRATPWSYQDEDGNWHTTSGAKPQPYLQPAVYNHTDEYREIAEHYLKENDL